MTIGIEKHRAVKHLSWLSWQNLHLFSYKLKLHFFVVFNERPILNAFYFWLVKSMLLKK